jgi:hypothetical protein
MPDRLPECFCSRDPSSLTLPAQVLGDLGLREIRVGVVDRELFCGALIDELLVQQPFDGPALGSSITKSVPRRDQLGRLLIDPALEASEHSAPQQGLLQASAGPLSLMPSAKSTMSWYQT